MPMPSTPFVFRFRYALHTVIYALGFFAPWNYWLHLDQGKTVWECLAIVFFQHGWLRFEAASITLLVLAIAFGALGAWVRTWGTAYISAGVMQSNAMHTGVSASGVVAGGPYRYVRNPLYLGTFLHTFALALIMPPSGAVFTLLLIGLLQLQLIFSEEPFLAAKLGQPYVDYCARVPRLLPAVPARVPASGARAHWPQAMLGEVYFIAVPLAFAVFGWSYNSNTLIRCVIVAAGLAMVVRALTPQRVATSHQSA